MSAGTTYLNPSGVRYRNDDILIATSKKLFSELFSKNGTTSNNLNGFLYGDKTVVGRLPAKESLNHGPSGDSHYHEKEDDNSLMELEFFFEDLLDNEVGDSWEDLSPLSSSGFESSTPFSKKDTMMGHPSDTKCLSDSSQTDSGIADMDMLSSSENMPKDSSDGINYNSEDNTGECLNVSDNDEHKNTEVFHMHYPHEYEFWYSSGASGDDEISDIAQAHGHRHRLEEEDDDPVQRFLPKKRRQRRRKKEQPLTSEEDDEDEEDEEHPMPGDLPKKMFLKYRKGLSRTDKRDRLRDRFCTKEEKLKRARLRKRDMRKLREFVCKKPIMYWKHC